jgi:hypothetical protein
MDVIYRVKQLCDEPLIIWMGKPTMTAKTIMAEVIVC